MPWICPRCQTVNGPGTVVCMNPNCILGAQVKIGTGTIVQYGGGIRCSCPIISAEHDRGAGCYDSWST